MASNSDYIEAPCLLFKIS